MRIDVLAAAHDPSRQVAWGLVVFLLAFVPVGDASLRFGLFLALVRPSVHGPSTTVS